MAGVNQRLLRHGECCGGLAGESRGKPNQTHMNAPVFIERTDAYLNSQWRESRTPWGRPRSPEPFVTISREAGSGGASLAGILSRKLNTEISGETLWRVYEGNVTARMLEANHLPVRFARFLPEDGIPEPNASIGEFVGLHPNLWELVQKTNETIRQLATAGHVILVGRGANFATAGLEGGIHVRLVASVEHRARYLARFYGISETEARAHNARCDAARRRYVRKTFNADVTDPTAYDLTINTGQMSLVEAAKLIGAQVRARMSEFH